MPLRTPGGDGAWQVRGLGHILSPTLQPQAAPARRSEAASKLAKAAAGRHAASPGVPGRPCGGRQLLPSSCWPDGRLQRCAPNARGVGSVLSAEVSPPDLPATGRETASPSETQTDGHPFPVMGHSLHQQREVAIPESVLETLTRPLSEACKGSSFLAH